MVFHAIWGVLFSLLPGAIPEGIEDAKEDLAVVICVSERRDEKHPLEMAAHSANLIATAFRAIGVKEENLTILKDKQVVPWSLRKKFEELAGRAENVRRLFVYYVGHGFKQMISESPTRAYFTWTTEEGPKGYAPGTTFNDHDLGDWLKPFREQGMPVVVFRECCFSGRGYSNSLESAGPGGVATARQVGTHELSACGIDQAAYAIPIHGRTMGHFTHVVCDWILRDHGDYGLISLNTIAIQLKSEIKDPRQTPTFLNREKFWEIVLIDRTKVDVDVTVMDLGTEKPLEAARVSVVHRGREGVTDAKGQVTIQDLKRGLGSSPTLKVECSGYFSREVRLDIGKPSRASKTVSLEKKISKIRGTIVGIPSELVDELQLELKGTSFKKVSLDKETKSFVADVKPGLVYWVRVSEKSYPHEILYHQPLHEKEKLIPADPKSTATPSSEKTRDKPYEVTIDLREHEGRLAAPVLNRILQQAKDTKEKRPEDLEEKTAQAKALLKKLSRPLGTEWSPRFDALIQVANQAEVEEHEQPGSSSDGSSAIPEGSPRSAPKENRPADKDDSNPQSKGLSEPQRVPTRFEVRLGEMRLALDSADLEEAGKCLGELEQIASNSSDREEQLSPLRKELGLLLIERVDTHLADAEEHGRKGEFEQAFSELGSARTVEHWDSTPHRLIEIHRSRSLLVELVMSAIETMLADLPKGGDARKDNLERASSLAKATYLSVKERQGVQARIDRYLKSEREERERKEREREEREREERERKEREREERERKEREREEREREERERQRLERKMKESVAKNLEPSESSRQQKASREQEGLPLARPEILDVSEFLPLRKNRYGYLEFRHKKTRVVFVLLLEGTAKLGSPQGESGRDVDEEKISLKMPPMLFAKHEITRRQWGQMIGRRYRGADRDLPMTRITYVEIVRTLMVLGWDLPSIYEWEYACRAGSPNPFSFGGTLTQNDANVFSVGLTKVGSYKPNRFGLFDMHGNAMEICRSGLENSGLLLKGGSYMNRSRECRSANIISGQGTGAREMNGFRPVIRLGDDLLKVFEDM